MKFDNFAFMIAIAIFADCGQNGLLTIIYCILVWQLFELSLRTASRKNARIKKVVDASRFRFRNRKIVS